MFFTAYLVRQLREIASIVGLTGIASEIVRESSDGVCALSMRRNASPMRWRAVSNCRATRGREPEATYGPRPPCRAVRRQVQSASVECLRHALMEASAYGTSVPSRSALGEFARLRGDRCVRCTGFAPGSKPTKRATNCRRNCALAPERSPTSASAASG
jgi:hypothetical protein